MCGGSDPHFGYVETITKTISGVTVIAWDHFFTDSPSFFRTENNAPGDTQLQFVTTINGLFVATLSLHYNATTWSGFLSYNGFALTGSTGNVAAPQPPGSPSEQIGQIQGWGTTGGGYFDASIFPVGGGSHQLDSARLLVQFWTNPPDALQVF